MTQVLARHTRLREVIPKWRSGRIGRTRLGWRHVEPGDYFERNRSLYRVVGLDGVRIKCHQVDTGRRRLVRRENLSVRGPVEVLHHIPGEYW